MWHLLMHGEYISITMDQELPHLPLLFRSSGVARNITLIQDQGEFSKVMLNLILSSPEPTFQSENENFRGMKNWPAL